VLILRGLPAIPDSQTYQVWLIAPNEERVSAGLLRPHTDLPFIAEPIDSTQDLANFVGMGMTIEPAGGSDKPTGLPIFRVDF
jgi:anti-sigma-K factor RskA